jgi:2'-5' RNA ligase
MTTPARQRYDAMWTDALPAIRAGEVDCDTRLLAGPDPRRGLTLIARPGPQLAAGFAHVLDRLAAIERGQYRHPAPDLHLTVLSLFTVTDDHAAPLARLAAYRDAVHAAVAGTPPLEIEFSGITASRGAVLAQGHPCGPALALLRERLRDALRMRGLDGTLDGRYKLVTAHATLLRFVRPLAAPQAFAAALEDMRALPLGSLHADQLDLVINDWYMTSASLQLVERITLTGS